MIDNSFYTGRLEVFRVDGRRNDLVHYFPFNHLDDEVVIAKTPAGQIWRVDMIVTNSQGETFHRPTGMVNTNGSMITVVLPDPMFLESTSHAGMVERLRRIEIDLAALAR